MPSGPQSVLACVRQRARCALVGEYRPDAIIRRLEGGPKYVPVSTLKSAFGSVGITLRDEETEWILTRFADNRRRIHWRKFISALDVAVPKDFTDPDKSLFDSLPQPYRLIVNILETEIVDSAWSHIVERHPELDPSPADEARAAADIDLRRSCPPSKWLLNPHPPILLLPRLNENVSKTMKEEEAMSAQKEDALGMSNEGHPLLDQENGAFINIANEGVEGENCYGGIMAVQLERRGEFLFTGGRDGSVCLRLTDAFDTIYHQLSIFPEGTNAVTTCLSHPVGSLQDQSGRPSSIRIAAAATTCGSDNGQSSLSSQTEGKNEGIGVGESTENGSLTQPLHPRSRVSVLELALPYFIASEDNSTEKGRHNNILETPIFNSISFVDIPEGAAASECTLSPDGNRLAVSLSSGRVATWILPPFSPFSEKLGAANATLDNSVSDSDEIRARERGQYPSATAEDGESFDGNATVAEEGSTTAAVPSIVLPPKKLGKPEFLIPHVPSPEENAYKKALQEYNRRLEAGEIPEVSAVGGKEGGSGDIISNLPPTPPSLSSEAYHSAHVDFLPAYTERTVTTVLDGDNGTHSSVVGGGGLALWRSHSNVWRFYQLPLFSPVAEQGHGAATEVPSVLSPEIKVDEASISTTMSNIGATIDGVNEQNIGGSGAPLMPIYKISSLPSAEWVLPSPITACAVSGESQGDGPAASKYPFLAGYEGGGGKLPGQKIGRSFASTPRSAESPLITIGTENGGVYLCEAALGLRREGLSRHRARVTALAFHGRRFIFSGSDDEMVHIHDIAGLGGRSSAVGRVVGVAGEAGTVNPPLRCLHDARGSEIARVVCLQETPLAFAEDTSGRIVSYDLVSGSMMGVLALGDTVRQTKEELPTSSTNEPVKYQNGSETPGITWTGSGNCLAVAVSSDEGIVSTGTSEKLGLWSAGDIMWGLSPGVRATVNHVRPGAAEEIAAIFYDLTPANRKAIEAYTPKHNPTNSNVLTPSMPVEEIGRCSLKTGLLSPTPPSPPQLLRPGQSPPRANRGSARHCELAERSLPGVGSGGLVSSRDGGALVKKTNPNEKVANNGSSHRQSRLTEGNVARLMKGNSWTAAAPGHGALAGEWVAGNDTRYITTPGSGSGGGGAGRDVAGRVEVGALERVRYYLENRHGERAARQSRLNDVTRNLLQSL